MEARLKKIMVNLNKAPLSMKQAKLIIKDKTTIPHEVKALVFIATGRDEEVTINLIEKAVKVRTHRQAKEIFRKFKKYCEDQGLDLHDPKSSEFERIEAEEEAERTKKAVKEAVRDLSSVLEIMNLQPKALEKKIINAKDGISQKEFIQDSLETYHLMMARAKGEIVTKKQTTKKKALRNEETGEFIGWEVIGDIVFDETVSHLPDGKAWGQALVIKEVIENLENSNVAFISDEEENRATVEMLTRKKAEREAYSSRGGTDDDVIEADIDEEEEELTDEAKANNLDELDDELQELD